MSGTEYTTARSLAIISLNNPKHRDILAKYASEVSVSCVAKALQCLLNLPLGVAK